MSSIFREDQNLSFVLFFFHLSPHGISRDSDTSETLLGHASTVPTIFAFIQLRSSPVLNPCQCLQATRPAITHSWPHSFLLPLPSLGSFRRGLQHDETVFCLSNAAFSLQLYKIREWQGQGMGVQGTRRDQTQLHTFIWTLHWGSLILHSHYSDRFPPPQARSLWVTFACPCTLTSLAPRLLTFIKHLCMYLWENY